MWSTENENQTKNKRYLREEAALGPGQVGHMPRLWPKYFFGLRVNKKQKKESKKRKEIERETGNRKGTWNRNGEETACRHTWRHPYLCLLSSIYRGRTSASRHQRPSRRATICFSRYVVSFSHILCRCRFFVFVFQLLNCCCLVCLKLEIIENYIDFLTLFESRENEIGGN